MTYGQIQLDLRCDGHGHSKIAFLGLNYSATMGLTALIFFAHNFQLFGQVSCFYLIFSSLQFMPQQKTNNPNKRP